MFLIVAGVLSEHVWTD